ncbi:hypothetical protein HDE_14136 [Halotydeus destructor]|nr:hypothetical protein HDE_14136 [Halotydeus destructor]
MRHLVFFVILTAIVSVHHCAAQRRKVSGQGSNGKQDNNAVAIGNVTKNISKLLDDILATLRGSSSNRAAITEARPNGAGCAGCETFQLFEPLTQLFQQLQVIVSSLGRILQPLLQVAIESKVDV